MSAAGGLQGATRLPRHGPSLVALVRSRPKGCSPASSCILPNMPKPSWAAAGSQA